MSASSSLDRESLQNILASAFVAQQSPMDAESRSAIMELLRLMRAGELEFGKGMDFIADRTRDVANATGVAIGLLRRDELVYVAGSGSAATYRGRHVMATLSASEGSTARREILRVENAQTEAGIRAAICRQFGANSLLILPIYHDRELAGVLEIFFTEAHAFGDHEVYTYRFMANMIEKAMCFQDEPKKSWTAEPSTLIHAIPPQMQSFPSGAGLPTNEDTVRPMCRTSVGHFETLPSERASSAGATIRTPKRAKRIRWQPRIRRFADRTALIAALMSASWIGYTCRHQPASPQQRSNAIEQQVLSTKVVPTNQEVSRFQSSAIASDEGKKDERARPKRVRVGDYQIDYISEDVTVRRFMPQSPLRHRRIGDEEVDYISDDVTVRHFSPKPAVLPIRSNTQASRP